MWSALAARCRHSKLPPLLVFFVFFFFFFFFLPRRVFFLFSLLCPSLLASSLWLFRRSRSSRSLASKPQTKRNEGTTRILAASFLSQASVLVPEFRFPSFLFRSLASFHRPLTLWFAVRSLTRARATASLYTGTPLGTNLL